MFLTPRGMSGGADMEKKIVRTMKVVILLAESGHFTISSSKFSRSGVAAATMRNRALETISQYILSAGQVIANTPPPPLPPQKTKPSLSRVLSKQNTIQVKDKEEEKEDTKPPPPPPRPPNMSELKRRMSMKTTKKKEQQQQGEEKKKGDSPEKVRRKSAKLGEGNIKSEGLICPTCKGVFETVDELLEHSAQCTWCSSVNSLLDLRVLFVEFTNGVILYTRIHIKISTLEHRYCNNNITRVETER